MNNIEHATINLATLLVYLDKVTINDKIVLENEGTI